MGVRQFELGVAVTLRLQSRSGRVEVVAEPREDVEAEGEQVEALVDDGGAALRIRNGHGSKPLLVRCPVGTDVAVGTQSGAVRMVGEFGAISVTTMSGRIEVDAADEADLRSVSANITIGTCRGRCRMRTSNGTATAGHVGALSAGTVSGSIKADRVDGAIKARSVSGSIEAASCGDGAITVKTISGKVHIELPKGVEPHTRFKSFSGRVHCECPEGSDLLIEAMTVSGAIEVVPT
ncbi:MAG TPA: DUF4097 family beta strand repeat-containing protein [Dehalococcoidia bacterium]|nr:DUF4097 family beta strand repeat-containing protein [Dehalococcoidia bacterium]